MYYKLRHNKKGFYLLESEDAKIWKEGKHFEDSEQALDYAFTNGTFIRER